MQGGALADAAFLVGVKPMERGRALTDKAGNPGFNRRYSGGNLRDQAHALSNDVIQALTDCLESRVRACCSK